MWCGVVNIINRSVISQKFKMQTEHITSLWVGHSAFTCLWTPGTTYFTPDSPNILMKWLIFLDLSQFKTELRRFYKIVFRVLWHSSTARCRLQWLELHVIKSGVIVHEVEIGTLLFAWQLPVLSLQLLSRQDSCKIIYLWTKELMPLSAPFMLFSQITNMLEVVLTILTTVIISPNRIIRIK